MGDLVYRIRGDDELSHAYVSKYTSGSSVAGYNPIKRHERYERTKEIVGRKARTHNPYGNYASPYYDPVKRREYYESHKTHPTRPYGVGSSGKGSGGRGSGGKGSGKGGKGSGKKGNSKGQNANMQKQIEALREQSALETEAQREATRRKIEDLRYQLSEQIKRLRQGTYDKTQSEKNMAEIRGLTQGLRSKIENLQGQNDKEVARVSKQLKEWISNERDSLERRIAAVYKTYGKTYTPRTQASKESASKKRDKEVTSRADSIYKSKKKK